jgi:multidrug transporter EmrE-like cation transporter
MEWRRDKKAGKIQKKAIVGGPVTPIEGEVPIRQYEMAKYQNFLLGLFAKGRLEVTNRRVIYRVTGFSFLGSLMVYSEYDVKHICGFDIRRNNRFSWPVLILSILLLILFGVIDMVLLQMAAPGDDARALFIRAGIALVALVLPLIFRKSKLFCHWLCMFPLMAGVLFLQSPGRSDLSQPASVLSIIVFIAGIFFCIIFGLGFAMLPDVSINILSDTAAANVISLMNAHVHLLDSAQRIRYGRDADRAISELGAILSDLHTYGDSAVQKWRNDMKKPENAQDDQGAGTQPDSPLPPVPPLANDEGETTEGETPLTVADVVAASMKAAEERESGSETAGSGSAGSASDGSGTDH